MILCYLYSKNNSLLLSGGNLQKKIELASKARDEAIDAQLKSQTDFDTINLDETSTDDQKKAAQKKLDDANKAVLVAERVLDEAQKQINTCTIDLKEVYDATDTLKDLKNRINTCGDSVEFTNPLKNEMPEDDSDVNIDDLTKSAIDKQAIIDAKKASEDAKVAADAKALMEASAAKDAKVKADAKAKAEADAKLAKSNAATKAAMEAQQKADAASKAESDAKTEAENKIAIANAAKIAADAENDSTAKVEAQKKADEAAKIAAKAEDDVAKKVSAKIEADKIKKTTAEVAMKATIEANKAIDNIAQTDPNADPASTVEQTGGNHKITGFTSVKVYAPF